MSKLRKSASFRSRIPIRNQRPIAARRYCSPYFGTPDGEESRYFAHDLNDFNFTRNRRRCSSSYSSSDESCASELTEQRIVKQYEYNQAIGESLMHTSTDAISLDGLLDNVSCCSSFSSPPSTSAELLVPRQPPPPPPPTTAPRSSSYESLDQFNEALATFDLSKPLRLCGSQSCTRISATSYRDKSITPMVVMPTTRPDEAQLASYSEKQRNLSDWYYVKTKSDVGGSTGTASRPEERTEGVAETRRPYGLSHCASAQSLPRAAGNAINTSTYRKSARRHEYVNAMRCAQPVGSAHDTGAVKVACNEPVERDDSEEEVQLRIHHRSPPPALSSSMPRARETPANAAQQRIPPYYCPPDYSTFHGCTKPGGVGATGNLQHGKVNIRLLREQYEQPSAEVQPLRSPTQLQPPPQQHHHGAVDSREASLGRRQQTRIDAHLKHWENMGCERSASPTATQLRPRPRPRPLQPQQQQHYAHTLDAAHSREQPRAESPPIAAPRRFVPPLVATPRPVQRSKLLQRQVTDEPLTDQQQQPQMRQMGSVNERPAGAASPLPLHRTELAAAAAAMSAELASPPSTPTRLKYPICDSPRSALRRPLPHPPTPASERRTKPTPPASPQHEATQHVQIKLQQNPVTRQLFGVVQDEVFHPKTPPVYRSDGELSGSYASLECPSPPGPPICLPEAQKDPQARLSNHLRIVYQELSYKEPIIPPWIMPVTPGVLCPARLEPDLRLNANSHGFSETLSVDQILASLQTKEGNFLEAPRRCLIECPAWTSRNNLCLRILHAWAKEPPWPTKGTPVALTLFIPLRELKRSFAQYIEKEILPKGPSNPFVNASGGFALAWNSLEALGPKLLIILDGYTNQKLGNCATASVLTPKKSKSSSLIGGNATLGKHHYPTDVHDLLEGRLFPEARVIVTTNLANCLELMPMVQRHIMYDGLTWGRSASILEGGQWDGPSRLLDLIQESVHLRNVVRSPLGCLAVAAIYETSNGDLPIEELDVVETILNCIAPEASSATISELGRLALFCLKMKRTSVSMAEIKMYCAAPDRIMSCLEKGMLYGKTAKKKGDCVFNPICPGMLEYLAANYIASLAARPGLLAAEITGMAIGDELEPELLKVLKFAMTLLGEQAHILLSRLTPLWLTPQIVFTLALAGGQRDANLAALCDILGISKHPPISPLETKPLWVQVRSMPTDLMGWGMALKSSTCTLKNLEIIYQLDKQKLAESRKAIEIFLDSITLNESVLTLRLSSLIEMDVKDSEISYLANCIAKLLLKPRLEHFELVLTLIEEDPPLMKLQPVVAALCRTIPRQSKMNSLLLDLGLSTSQLVQLCAAVEKCPNITRLSLPHLRCERGAVAALAALLTVKPISFLSLPSCWGVRDDPPSSSGVSMGSGSGSSTGTSCLIKQGSLPGVPSPRSYAPGIFSSLPRGVFVPQSSLGRSATLPRQPIEQNIEKRSCDSVVSKIWYPTPTCEGGPHNSGTMHDLFLAIRSKLHSLDLSKAQLSLEDAMCLGETVRLSNTLHTLKFEGSARVSEVLPTVLGASESPCLQMLSVGSQRLNLEDSMAVICARALTSCVTLRLLSLDGWCFRIEHAQTLAIIRAFLSLTSIRELSLSNCRLHTNLIKKDAKVSSHLFESRSLVVLKLAGAQVTLTDLTVLRGPQLLQYISGFTCLRELDLSAPARSGIESTHSSPLILDDKNVVHFFQHLHGHFSLLNTLKICNWIMHFDDFNKTLKTIAKALRNSPISHLKLDGISVLDRPRKQRSESAFIHCFIAALPHLRWLGISLSNKKEEQITAIGSAVLDLKGSEIEIKLTESTIDQAKLMAQAISIDGKFDIKVSTFGTSSGILIHAEKSGLKSLSRKTRDKDQYF